MAPWNLLLLPLLGGYIFFSRCTYYRIKCQRFDNYRVVLESAVWGVLFGALGRLIASAVEWSGVQLDQIQQLAPFEYIGTASIAFALGPAFSWLVNWWVDEVRSKDIAIEQHGDNLLALFVDAMDHNDAVIVTLTNKKVYAGYVWETPNLETTMTSVLLLPVMSGYRKSETLEVQFTTDYISLWRDRPKDVENFVVVIPIASITSASMFDESVYSRTLKPDASSASGSE